MKDELTQTELKLIAALAMFGKAQGYRKDKKNFDNPQPEQLQKDRVIITYKRLDDGWLTRKELAKIVGYNSEANLAAQLTDLKKKKIVQEAKIVYRRPMRKKERLELIVNRLNPNAKTFEIVTDALISLHIKDSLAYHLTNRTIIPSEVPVITESDYFDLVQKQKKFEKHLAKIANKATRKEGKKVQQRIRDLRAELYSLEHPERITEMLLREIETNIG